MSKLRGYPHDQIEAARTEYSPIWRISQEVFKQRAVEILGIRATRIQLHRQVTSGPNWGKLSVYVFISEEYQKYYQLQKGDYYYDVLPTHIDEFSRVLAEKIKSKDMYLQS